MNDELSRTERRKRRTRESLLAAGQHQIATIGLSSLSIQSTTTLADVALGTFYNHFANKEELVREVLRLDTERTEAAIDWLQLRASGPLERTTAVVAACVWRAIQEPGWARFVAEFWAIGRWPAVPGAQWVLRPELEAGLAIGSFDVSDVDLTIVSMRDVLGGLMRCYADLEGAVEDRVLMQHTVAVVLRAVGASGDAIDRAVRWALSHPLELVAFEEVA